MNYTTFTIALSIKALKNEIAAQTAWIDTTNLSVLPPISNPVTAGHNDIAAIITESCYHIATAISGYVKTVSHSDDIFTMQLCVPANSNLKLASIRIRFEQAATYHTLATLYCTQPQAAHITSLFREKGVAALRSVTHLLASTQKLQII